jgi:hypothetical protein
MDETDVHEAEQDIEDRASEDVEIEGGVQEQAYGYSDEPDEDYTQNAVNFYKDLTGPYRRDRINELLGPELGEYGGLDGLVGRVQELEGMLQQQNQPQTDEPQNPWEGVYQAQRKYDPRQLVHPETQQPLAPVEEYEFNPRLVEQATSQQIDQSLDSFRESLKDELRQEAMEARREDLIRGSGIESEMTVEGTTISGQQVVRGLAMWIEASNQGMTPDRSVDLATKLFKQFGSEKKKEQIQRQKDEPPKTEGSNKQPADKSGKERPAPQNLAEAVATDDVFK